MKPFQLASLLLIFLTLLTGCAAKPVPIMTLYDGNWAGNINCSRNYNEDPPFQQSISVIVNQSKIDALFMHFQGSEDKNFMDIANFKKSDLIDDGYVRLIAYGHVDVNGDIKVSTSAPSFRGGPFPIEIRGDFTGNQFDIKAVWGNSMWGRNCQGSIERQTLPPHIKMASTETSLPILAPGKVDGFGRYHALVIGVDQYSDLPDLESSVHDAMAMASLLEEQYGFGTELLINPTRDDIIRALSSYRNKLEYKDNLLIYYAGHGWLDKEADQGYWLPTDATRSDESNWLSNSTLTSSLRAIQAKHVMVISDSCFSGKLVRGLKMKQRDAHYLDQLINKKSRTVMTSGGLEPVLDKGGKNDHSVFASALIDALTNNNGVLEGSLLFSQVRRPVTVNADQTPEYADIRKAGHDGGDFLFVKKSLAQ